MIAKWSDERFSSETIDLRMLWFRRFDAYCKRRVEVSVQQLTKEAALQFARTYARQHSRAAHSVRRRARASLHAWSEGLRALGMDVPLWEGPRYPREFRPLLSEYQHWRRSAGVQESSLRCECDDIVWFWSSRKGNRTSPPKPAEIDQFITGAGRRYAPKTVARTCSSIRCYLRFLHATGRTPADLSFCVGPVRGRVLKPPPLLRWSDIRKILASVDRRTLLGRRDYAAMLLMAAYGMGRGEVVGLRLDDIDWHEKRLRVARPKTGVRIELPLLDAVAQALASYLRLRLHSDTRKLFLCAVAPHAPMRAHGLSHIVRKYAATAGLSISVGTHAFRRSHACRQIESAAPSKVISDILGHSNPDSISSYVRIAQNHLRAICLPIPE